MKKIILITGIMMSCLLSARADDGSGNIFRGNESDYNNNTPQADEPGHGLDDDYSGPGDANQDQVVPIDGYVWVLLAVGAGIALLYRRRLMAKA